MKKALLLLTCSASAWAQNDEAAQVAEAFMQASIAGDSEKAAALLVLPSGTADAAAYRSSMQDCLAQAFKEYPPRGTVLGSESKGDSERSIVTLKIQTDGKTHDADIPLQHTADGWRIVLTAQELNCASTASTPEEAAVAYLDSLDGYIYDRKNIETVQYNDAKDAAEVIINGSGHAVIPKPVQEPYRLSLQTYLRNGRWQVDESCGGHCHKWLPLNGK